MVISPPGGGGGGVIMPTFGGTLHNPSAHTKGLVCFVYLGLTHPLVCADGFWKVPLSGGPKVFVITPDGGNITA